MAVQTKSNERAHYAPVGVLTHPGGDGRLAAAVYECPVCLALTRNPDAHQERCGGEHRNADPTIVVPTHSATAARQRG